ncbi:MAG: anthrone oxygenase family protein [Acidimicrobiales bacterium]
MNAFQLVGLIPVGALFGNELATLLVHTALFELPDDEHLAAEQAIHRILGKVMPVYMVVAVAGAVALTIGAEGTGATGLAVLATGCLVAMLVITLAGNVPINKETMRLGPGVDADLWQGLRRQWTNLHVMRVALDGAAFVLACLSIATS